MILSPLNLTNVFFAVTPVESGMVSEKEFVQAEVRSDFKDAVLWSPYSVTDENGYAEVSLNFPDNGRCRKQDCN